MKQILVFLLIIVLTIFILNKIAPINIAPIDTTVPIGSTGNTGPQPTLGSTGATGVNY